MVAFGVGTFGGGDEIGGDQGRPLVEELVERVLAVGAGLAEDHRAGGVVHGAPVPGDALAVALHVHLLQVGGQAAQGLIVGQHGMARRAQEIRVPHAEQGQDDRHVGLQGGAQEVFVHGAGAGQQGLEAVHAGGDGDGEADGRPQGIAPPHPVPEFEHVGRIDAERRHRVPVGRQRGEVPRHGPIPQGAGQPGARRGRVGQGLGGGEGLRRDQEQGGFRVEPVQGPGHMAAVDVGDEMDAKARPVIGRQRLDHHRRAQVGAADADVDHVGDGFPGLSRPRAVAHRVREHAHAREHRVHPGHHVLAVDQDRRARTVAQRRVQDGAVLGGVDLVAPEHAFPPALDVGLAGEVEQQRHGLGGDAVLGVIEEHLADGKREALESLRVPGEQVPHVDARHCPVVGFQRLPGGGASDRRHRCGPVPLPLGSGVKTNRQSGPQPPQGTPRE